MQAAHAYAQTISDLSYDDDLSRIGNRTKHAPYFFVFDTEEQFESLLSNTNSIFIEASRSHIHGVALEEFHIRDCDFSLALNSFMVSMPQMSRIVTQAINTRFGLHHDCCLIMQTCMQEALANAMMHGNLMMQRDCDTLDGFNLYYNTLKRMLNDPHYGHMHIYVTVSYYGRSIKVGVTHTGRGALNDHVLIDCHPRLAQKSGRGLYLIQTLAEQVWCNDNGKSLYFTFPI